MATRVYCFVHKVPVCGECICFPEHQLCVVSFSTSVILIIWPPSSIKDTGSHLHANLKEAIVQVRLSKYVPTIFSLIFHFSNMLQTGLEKNVFGNHFVTKADTRTPPAFASDPLKRLSTSGDGESVGANTVKPAKDAALPSTLQSGMYSSSPLGSGTAIHVEPEIVEVDGPSPIVTQFPEQESNFIRSPSPHGPGAMTRKGATSVDRQNSEISYYADDEDGNRKKYTKRGKQFGEVTNLPCLYPFYRACIATMGILYYRLSQRSLSDNFAEDEPQ
ncbi:hypothetical protein PR202_gb29129 [Eleusine coracana subsp. coracana]|uniref:ZFPL1-like B-box zinc-binding domain-containing protein n=1 Tax=Eleusine coracana subsp. coracana TaxID=191504 RepID=A0AAV5FZI8_ELECO|nr:hypothetical protein PR202_gb29129 [Eleusine coracana subsp. coracana]